MSLTGNEEFQWGIPQQLAYEGLKEAVVVETVLFIPQDGGKFRLEADASNYAMGAVVKDICIICPYSHIIPLQRILYPLHYYITMWTYSYPNCLHIFVPIWIYSTLSRTAYAHVA